MGVKLRYALFGVAFGTFFPIGASIFELILNNLSFSFESIKHIHAINPLLYIIDSAPVWLGLFAFFGGVQQAKSNNLLYQFEQVSKILSQCSSKLNTDANETFSEMKKELNQLAINSKNMKGINDGINGNISYCKENSGKMSEVAEKMLTSINTLFSFNNKAKKENEVITTGFLDFVTKTNNITVQFERVKSIGKEINVLALNSGIEASKIGEKAKGFSVIAKNIKELAEKTFSINSTIDELLKVSKEDVETIKDKINRGQENLLSLNKVYKSLENEMQVFKSSLENILSIIQDTYQKNNEQNIIFETLNASVSNIESTYSIMMTSLSEAINDETSVVEEINRLKASKAE